MKKFYASIVACIFCGALLNAQTRYWRLAPGVTGDWDNPNSWSATSGGGPAGDFPNGTGYNVIFNSDALVRIDIDNIDFNTLSITGSKTVKLFVDNPPSGNSVLTAYSTDNLNPALSIQAGSNLEDSCVSNSLFNFTFALGAKGRIDGTWYFSGSSNVVDDTKGPTFTVPKDNVGSNHPRVDVNGTIRLNNRTATPLGEQESLFFNNGSVFWLDRNGGTNPFATWDENSSIKITGVTTIIPSISVPTNPGEIGSIQFDCPNISTDLGWALTRRLIIKGDFQILNTNNKKITISTTTGAFIDYTVNGTFEISGSSNIIFANPSADKPYTLIVLGNFNLLGGSFSLRNDPLSGPIPLTQPTKLLLAGNLNHTGGTFEVNSTATNTTTDLFIVELDGTVNQNITSVTGTIDNLANQVTLRMNNAAGATLLSPLSVGKLDFNSPNKGRLFTTATNILTINNTGTGNLVVNTPGNSGHVNGPVRRKTALNSAYLFPTGKGGILRYTEVIPVNTSTSLYEAEYFNSGYPNRTVVLPLRGVANNQYWDIKKISGSDAAIQLNLAGPVGGALAADTLYVAHFNSGISHWESAMGSTGTKLTPGNSTSGSVRSDNLSSFSPFTFGFSGAIALPVQLITFNAKKLSGNSAQLIWTISENSTPDNFEVLKSLDGRNFNPIATIPSIARKYSYDLLDNNLANRTTYYRLKLVDKDGSVAFSKVVAVLNGIKGVLITSMMPTIVKDRSRLNISSSDNGNMRLTVTDIHGRIVKQQAAGIVEGNQEVWLDLQMLSNGTYYVTGYFNGQRTSAIGFIKQ